jgi:hypothetical protein
MKRRKGGDCFERHGRIVLNRDGLGMLLCHGMVSGQGALEGRRFMHCWLEIGDAVIDLSNGLKTVLRKEQYYKVGKINPKEVRRYTEDAASRMIYETGHFGPWE